MAGSTAFIVIPNVDSDDIVVIRDLLGDVECDFDSSTCLYFCRKRILEAVDISNIDRLFKLNPSIKNKKPWVAIWLGQGISENDAINHSPALFSTLREIDVDIKLVGHDVWSKI